MPFFKFFHHNFIIFSVLSFIFAGDMFFNTGPANFCGIHIWAIWQQLISGETTLLRNILKQIPSFLYLWICADVFNPASASEPSFWKAFRHHIFMRRTEQQNRMVI